MLTFLATHFQQIGYYKLISIYMGNFIYSYKYLFSMTVLKYDDIIKKSRDLDYYFDIFWKISFSTTLMIMMMMNCFCGVVDRRKAFSLISSRGHCQRSSPSWISDTPQAGHIARALLVQGLWHFVPPSPPLSLRLFNVKNFQTN